jgi:hypothetical protein
VAYCFPFDDIDLDFDVATAIISSEILLNMKVSYKNNY